MTGLIIKDLLNLKKYLKTLVLLIVFYAVIFIPQGEINFVSSFILILSVAPTITALAYDDMVNWDKYALTMPINKKDIVMSKYILMIMFILLGAIASFFICFITKVFNIGPVNMSEIAFSTLLVTCIGIIYDDIILPLVYKFGTEKARIVILAVIFIPISIVYILSKTISKFTLSNIISFLDKIQNTVPIIVIGSAIVMTAASYFISYNIFSKKEM